MRGAAIGGAQPLHGFCAPRIHMQGRVKLLQHAQIVQTLEIALGVRLLQNPFHLVANACRCHPAKELQRVGQQFQRARLNLEAKALFIANGAQDARGIIHKAQAVEGSGRG